MSKSCGDCTACCTLSVVQALNKRAWETCIWCVNKGCSIYGSHPQQCKEFECAYLQSNAPVELRPDNCGVMFVKKNDRIFTGILVPGVEVSNVAKGQVEAFKRQGFSVVLLKKDKKPSIQTAPGHNRQEIYREYVELLKDGHLQH